MKKLTTLTALILASTLFTALPAAAGDEESVSGTTNCEITHSVASQNSITIDFDVSDCKDLYTGTDDGLARICLKKKNSAVNACRGGQVKYSDEKSGSISFNGLVSDTSYRVRLYSAKGSSSDRGKFVKYVQAESTVVNTN